MGSTADAETQSVQRFGRNARAFCVLLFVTAAVMTFWMITNIVRGPFTSDFAVGLGAYEIRGEQIDAIGVKTWCLLIVATLYALVFMGLFHLYRLFCNLARGEIYTKDNVLKIRRLGEIALALAVLKLLLPVFSLIVLNLGLIREASVTPVSHDIGPDAISLLITASLVLLASKIMELGRRTTEEAEEMRRDAELVV